MRRLPLKNLLLSSVLAVILGACSPASGYRLLGTSVITAKEVRPIVNRNNSLLYKAKINLYTKYFSGLIILKQTDSITSHLTFITEIGMKMFDFEVQHNNFKLVYVFAPLNKPKILKLLENDMKLILLEHLLNQEAQVYEKKPNRIYKRTQKLKYYFKSNVETKTIEKITVKGSLFTKEKVWYFYNSDLNAKQVRLKHKGLIRLKIELNNITKQNP